MDLSKAFEMAMNEFGRHQLIDWTFKIDRCKRRFGNCSYNRRTISLSGPLTLLNSESEVRDTILHEIAHALVGRGHHHDITWQQKAASIGARPIRCYGADIAVPTPKYIGRCTGCSAEWKRYKITGRMLRSGYHPACARAGRESKIDWHRA